MGDADRIDEKSLSPFESTADFHRATRRTFLAGTLSVAAAAALAVHCGGGGGDDDSPKGSASNDDATDDDAGSTDDDDAGNDDAGNTCTVYPEETEGPYFLDLDMIREDVTEGKPGAALSLTLLLQRASDCEPIKDIAVDIWHCDADGVYSGYLGQLGGVDTSGLTFLRGTQITGADGRVRFMTIYPGWYPGRTTHIHFKVHLTGMLEATSQLYFPEDATETVYATAPYDARGQKDTTNLSDGVTPGSVPPLPAVSPDGAGYAATLTVTVAGL
ncbi:MAG: intradiol ring-cleavage dioxygenase [Deltaproteobacteria bacterium]|nr:intradiol ring-cleavage dioxygenase [Deltaproteobacteria bacterium]